ncbi:MAG: hypothetical protein AAB956_02450, partial [Patescibacteria group bacterium]
METKPSQNNVNYTSEQSASLALKDGQTTLEALLFHLITRTMKQDLEKSTVASAEPAVSHDIKPIPPEKLEPTVAQDKVWMPIAPKTLIAPDIKDEAPEVL